MRPILFKSDEKVFDSYGLGEIDATKATATRERNGNYTLYLEYPAGQAMASQFKPDMRIKADAGVRTKNQTFIISRIVKDSSHLVKVYAKHISHLTEHMGLVDGVKVDGTARDALYLWSKAVLGGQQFDVWSDIDTIGKTSWTVDKVKTARDALGGVEGSILDIWGGEYQFDNTTIRLHKQLGRKAPTVLEYGRNILSAEDDEDIESAYTSIYPYATYTPQSEGGGASESVTVTLPEKVVDSEWLGLYADRRVLAVDLSSKFGEKETPTADKLRNHAKAYVKANRIGLPKTNTKVEYVDLAKTLDYADMAVMEEVELCDIVPIYYPSIGLTNDEGKVVVVNYDVLNDRNESIEIGMIGQSMRSAMASTVADRLDVLENRQAVLDSSIPAYLLSADGNKVWYSQPDNSKEHKVGDTWFEKNGEYNRIYIWNGEMWEKVMDSEVGIALLNDGIEQAKAKAEEEAQKLRDEISEQFASFDNEAIQQANQKAEEALQKVGANEVLANEAKTISSQVLADLEVLRSDSSSLLGEFPDQLKALKEELGTERRARVDMSETLDGIQTSIDAVGLYFDKKGRPSEKLSQYVRSETAESLSAIRVELGKDFVKQSSFTDAVNGINRRFENVLAPVDGKIASKIAEYKQGVDGRFATITSQLNGKVNTTDFQRVKETSQLYERIIGGTEKDITDKVARMVMSNQIFQTEVGKVVKVGGTNLVRNSGPNLGNSNFWNGTAGLWATNQTHIFYKNGKAPIFNIYTSKAELAYIQTSVTNKLEKNTDYTLSFLGFMGGNVSKFRCYVGLLSNTDTRWKRTLHVYEGRLSSGRAERIVVKFNSGDYDGFSLRFDHFGSSDGKGAFLGIAEIKVEKGTIATDWSPAPEDVEQKVEAVSTRVTQLNNSWAVQHLTSAGSIAGQINSQANRVLIDYSKIRLKGKTLADEIDAIDGKFKKLFVADGTFSKLNAGVITANSIDSDKIRVNSQLAQKLVADKAFVSSFFADKAVIGQIQAIDIDASRVTSGVLNAKNGAMKIDLNNATLSMNSKAKFQFLEKGNAFFYEKNKTTAWLTFDDTKENRASVKVGVSQSEVYNGSGHHIGFAGFISENYPLGTNRRLGAGKNRIVGGELMIVPSEYNTTDNFGIYIDTAKFGGLAKLDLYKFVVMCNKNFRDLNLVYKYMSGRLSMPEYAQYSLGYETIYTL